MAPDPTERSHLREVQTTSAEPPDPNHASPSVLGSSAPPPCRAQSAASPSLRDLNLDRVIDEITAGRPWLKAFFNTPLQSSSAVQYRQEVMRDVQNEEMFDIAASFVASMRQMRDELTRADTFRCEQQKRRWFLEAALTYCSASDVLASRLGQINLTSRGIRNIREYVQRYVGSLTFVDLRANAEALKRELDEICYCVRIKGGTVTISKYDSEPDYNEEFRDTSKAFAGPDHHRDLVVPSETVEVNDVEAKILESVARLFPETFARLDGFVTRYTGFVNETLSRFDREIQFYTSFQEYIRPLRDAGLEFCLPALSPAPDSIFARDGFDIALARKLCPLGDTVVLNDFDLRNGELILLVSGPNQGGKTTFARMFGQLHYLASIGVSVPASSAKIVLADRIFAHFQREESTETLRSRLEDDLIRIRDMLDEASERSIFVINELFSSTTLSDAYELTRRLFARLLQVRAMCVYVTFLDDLAGMSNAIASLACLVDEDNPSQRTYKIERRAPYGLSHALRIAEQHRLTYDRIRERGGKRR